MNKCTDKCINKYMYIIFSRAIILQMFNILARREKYLPSSFIRLQLLRSKRFISNIKNILISSLGFKEVRS